MLIPFGRFFWLAKILELHLIKLPRAKDEIPDSHLIPEGLADLTNAQGELAPRRGHNTVEVHVDALGCLGSHVGGMGMLLLLLCCCCGAGRRRTLS